VSMDKYNALSDNAGKHMKDIIQFRVGLSYLINIHVLATKQTSLCVLLQY
jgi:hypothetical protein